MWYHTPPPILAPAPTSVLHAHFICIATVEWVYEWGYVSPTDQRNKNEKEVCWLYRTRREMDTTPPPHPHYNNGQSLSTTHLDHKLQSHKKKCCRNSGNGQNIPFRILYTLKIKSCSQIQHNLTAKPIHMRANNQKLLLNPELEQLLIHILYWMEVSNVWRVITGWRGPGSVTAGL